MDYRIISRFVIFPRLGAILLLLVAVGLVLGLDPAQAAGNPLNEPLVRLRLSAADPQATTDYLETVGYDVLRGSITETTVDVIVSSAEQRELSRSGLRGVVIDRGRPFAAQIRAEAIGQPDTYPDLAAIMTRLRATATAYPDIVQLVDLTETYQMPTTFEGRHQYALKISDNAAANEDEPAVLVVSNHHARELVTPVIAFYAIEQLTEGYGQDMRITDLVDRYQIWVAPIWNPDGYNWVFTGDHLWRKNRRIRPGGIGIDLNRNYPQGWNTSCSGTLVPTSNSHKGPSSGSEPETQTMMAWSMDQRFAKVLDYHSRGREVLWGYACPEHPFDEWLQEQATALSVASGYAGKERPPSADGEHYQWQLAQMGANAFLIETALEFQPPYDSAVAEAAQVWPGLLHALERPIPLTGHVTDAVTGAPVAAVIEIDDEDFEALETYRSGGAFGRYHVTLPPDDYELRFTARGYQPLQREVDITDYNTYVLDVQLQPNP